MKLHRALLVVVVGLVGCDDLDQYPYASCAYPGGEGCECKSRDICDRLADGTPLVCDEGICVVPTCEEGAAGGSGCQCGAAGSCDEGFVCTNGFCAEDTGQTLAPPEDPRCYTPCKGSGQVNQGGQTIYAECSPDGLIEGCVGDAVCRNGTCVVPRASGQALRAAQSGAATTLGACTIDADCPFFQACIQGQCYSDCRRDSDCREGRACHQNVCRLPCDATDPQACPREAFCATEDGSTGFCMPLPTSTAPEAPPHREGTFEVAPSRIELGTLSPAGTFTIENQSGEDLTFEVKKLRHREFDADGAHMVVDAPLFWLELGETAETAEVVERLSVTVPAQSAAEVHVAGVDNPDLDRWEGVLEVSQARLGTQEVALSYARSAKGRWAGNMYFLASFPTGGLEAWMANKADRDALRSVSNAFIRRWGAFRDQRISRAEFVAAITALENESWKWASVKERCPSREAPNPNVGCYLYDNEEGISIFSEYLPDNPIPTGVSQLPVAFDLRPETGSQGVDWIGKVVSEQALHLAGEPAVTMTFASDPDTCEEGFGDTCITFLDTFSTSVFVGGRYLTDALDTDCRYAAAGTFELHEVPWLVPGFERNTALDAVTGGRYRYECRDRLLPFGDAPDVEALNLAAAGSNPVPDGATRRRTIELVDGAMVDQDFMFIIFRERFPSFLSPSDPQGFDAYGYITLQRAPMDLADEDYLGREVSDFRPPPTLPDEGCADWIMQTVLPGATEGVTDANASTVGRAVVSGLRPTDEDPPIIDSAHPETVHYLCSDTGLFDGGSQDDGVEDVKVPCPTGSEVVFFTITGPAATQASIAAEACQTTPGICLAGEPCDLQSLCTPGETCHAKSDCRTTLESWVANGTHGIRLNPVWHCQNSEEVYCAYDRLDLRRGKVFYGEDAATAVFRSLDDEIFEAYRYKTRFRNRAGGSVGFAPQVCETGADSVPYCYDPAAIEGILDRVDCAARVYTEHYDALDPDAKVVLKRFLVRNFGYEQQIVPGLATPWINDGNERLFAELTIMLGDESFTSAFASRFDLAGQQIADFEGAQLEPNGINLSGGAGFEMYSLYQAAQYYQLALDRFFSQSALIWRSMAELPAGQGFITQRTAASYLDRLIRASSQKARVWSAVSQRYQSFNRPDLARGVVERAYTSAYLEAVILSRMMTRLIDVSAEEDEAQITAQLELAQRTYRAALLDMRSVYAEITDDVTFYGIPPDYVPFPALGPDDDNAFVESLAVAERALETAAEKEARALEDSRDFETDAELFQAELARIRDEAEGELAELCGTFETEDGAIYPAIPKYAYLDDRASLMGDPCGRMGNGALHEAIANIELSKLDFEGIQLAARNLQGEYAALETRANEQCGRIQTLAGVKIAAGETVIALSAVIDALQIVIDTTSDIMDIAGNLAGLTKCTVGTSNDCPTAAVSLTTYTGVAIIGASVNLSSRVGIAVLQAAIREIELGVEAYEIFQECTAVWIDTRYDLTDVVRRALEVQLEAVKAQYQIKLAFSSVLRMRHDALSIMAGQSENEQLAINIEAARNDPNVRIYRNDAVYAADRTFYRALKEAYRATKVFEYYTSQSYADAEKLYLVRMVKHGDFTLESYLADLAVAYREFEEEYGVPDTRVEIVSVKDHVLKVPFIDGDGVALSEAERSRRFREAIQDVGLLDQRGYITMSFATALDRLSPLTANHKVRYVEAEIIGDDVGDGLGRLYLTQRGTGVVRGVDGEKAFFALPERTAVVDAVFNGERPLDPAVYVSERLRDRPLVNTGWELVLNTKDEAVNEDITLGSLTDIRLFLYYTDFTRL